MPFKMLNFSIHSLFLVQNSSTGFSDTRFPKVHFNLPNYLENDFCEVGGKKLDIVLPGHIAIYFRMLEKFDKNMFLKAHYCALQPSI